MRSACLLFALLLSPACGDDDGPGPGDGEPRPLELPRADTVAAPVEPSPSIVVRLDRVAFEGDLFRLDLQDGRLPGEAVTDGSVPALARVLESLRDRVREAQGLPAERPFRSVLVLRADRRVPAATVEAVARTAAEVGFVTLQVAVRTDAGTRQMAVRVEKDVLEPHLQTLVGPNAVTVAAPGLAAALQAACGEEADGPLELGRPGDWSWGAIPECRSSAIRTALARTPSAGVTAVGDVSWGGVVHVFDRLRQGHPRPEGLTLLLE